MGKSKIFTYIFGIFFLGSTLFAAETSPPVEKMNEESAPELIEISLTGENAEPDANKTSENKKTLSCWRIGGLIANNLTTIAALGSLVYACYYLGEKANANEAIVSQLPNFARYQSSRPECQVCDINSFCHKDPTCVSVLNQYSAAGNSRVGAIFLGIFGGVITLCCSIAIDAALYYGGGR